MTAQSDHGPTGGFVCVANFNIKGVRCRPPGRPTTPARLRKTRNLIRAVRRARGPPRSRPRSARRWHSCDADDDPRGQVFTSIGDGTIGGAMCWIDALLYTAKEFDEPATGGTRPLGTAIAVLEVLLGRRGRTKIPNDSRPGGSIRRSTGSRPRRALPGHGGPRARNGTA